MNTVSKYKYTLALPMMLLLAGCNGLLPRSQYTRPDVTLPQQWQETGITGTTVAAREQWWRDFNDPALSELIERALKTNNDLAAAAIRVRRAQLSARLTGTNLTPSVSVGATSSITRDLKNHVNTKTSGVTGTASYELDLWGKLSSARDTSRWEAEATESDRQSTALSLIGTVATNYWQIAYLNERIATVEASIAYAEKIWDLTEVKYRAGAVSALDQTQARQTVAAQKAQLTELLQQRTEARNALAILFDQAPENSVPERQRLPDGSLPTVAAGLPASLLGQRPDLRAAEQRLRKYLASIDTTRASYYPSFTLTGTLGTSSTSLLDLLRNPYAALGAGVTLPFIQWNTMKLNEEISKTEYEEAVVTFRQSLYSALSDVENALSARTRTEEEVMQLEESLALAKKAEELAEIRYRAGSTALQPWLDAQESRRDAERALAAVRLNRLRNCMALYQAIGGPQSVAAGS
ncbi:efflux transporter outer membrane subunit [Geobacter hydrogenophilus]|uniref:Outer membrane efflux protein n=1 Tax=Geobacter hydrogenophilus TaxID=40983 RepID=A0A9W6G0I6_9BACT|nr:efflux transporter outer membrane subunit [Geobacter hydrogenophilus]MBT0893894.1 efflux transporter outer membrane subunit [Geobacter hydrogenophilus]GLI38162.1 outer membrane efflux protein [Geobacter hydrogenophilus]